MSNILNNEIKAAISAAHTIQFAKDFGKTVDKVFWADAQDTVAAIPAAAFPAESSYHLVGIAQVAACVEALAACDHLKPSTLANKKTNLKNAVMGELHRVATLRNTAAALEAANDAQQAKPTKAAAKKVIAADKRAAIAAAVEVPTSLDLASAAGKKAARRKASKIKVAQPAKKTGSKTGKAKPTKSEAAAAVEARKVDRDLIQQALAHAKEISAKGDKATDKQRIVALGGVAAIVDTLAKYLPADMQTI